MKPIAQLLLKLYRSWLMLPPGARSLGVLTVSKHLHGLLRRVMSPTKARLLVAVLVLLCIGALILDGHEIARVWADGEADLEMLLGEFLR